jgi:hypothetical protein
MPHYTSTSPGCPDTSGDHAEVTAATACPVTVRNGERR